MAASSSPSPSGRRDYDYHGHPSYVAVWLWLVILFLGSLTLGALGNHRLAVAMVFTLAVVKALIVLGNFMHLRWEPRLVWGIAAFGFLCLLFHYLGVLPDLLFVEPRLAK